MSYNWAQNIDTCLMVAYFDIPSLDCLDKIDTACLSKEKAKWVRKAILLREALRKHQPIFRATVDRINENFKRHDIP